MKRVGILPIEVYEKGREICHLGLWKGPKRKRCILVIDSYLNDSAFKAVIIDAGVQEPIT